MIDLTDYTPRRRRFIKERGFVCLYSIGPKPEGPTKIGIADDIVARLNGLGHAHWADLFCYYVLWTPGRPVAARIESRCHELLRGAGKGKRGEWFDIPADWGRKTIDAVAHSMHPNAVFYSHEGMTAHLKKKILEKRDLALDVSEKTMESANQP